MKLIQRICRKEDLHLHVSINATREGVPETGNLAWKASLVDWRNMIRYQGFDSTMLKAIRQIERKLEEET